VRVPSIASCSSSRTSERQYRLLFIVAPLPRLSYSYLRGGNTYYQLERSTPLIGIGVLLVLRGPLHLAISTAVAR
jgi:hypothetical protein